VGEGEWEWGSGRGERERIKPQTAEKGKEFKFS
jgi:hypothetical protein